jgi:type IV pilus modification protein PilV
MGEGVLMKASYINDKGFSLTELMFAMTILAIGLLALAQMQMMAMRGTTSASKFSTATKIAREGMERMKIPGSYVISGSSGVLVNIDPLIDQDKQHNGEASMAPQITTDQDISTLRYDYVEVFEDTTDETPPDYMSLVIPACEEYFPNNCNARIADDTSWDFVRITNVKNWPPGSEMHSSVMKEVSTIVLWKERGLVRSISLRTIVGRKDNDFY